MAQSVPIISNVARRYASALFDLALAEKKLPAVEKDLQRFDAVLQGSEDFSRLVASPVFSSDDQINAVSAIVEKAKITGIVGNFIKVVANNRRAEVMPQLLMAFKELLAEHRGEETADVSVAKALSAAQTTELKTALKSAVGKDVDLAINIDPSLLGGMIVKIGSRQIDTTLKTKLSSLKLALKEVG